MAKNNNLTDFLTDVADAIRAKKETQALINPQDFSSEIASIPTSGGEVNEYDLIISKGGYGLLDDFTSYLILNGGYN